MSSKRRSNAENYSLHKSTSSVQYQSNRDSSGHNQHRRLKTGSDSYIISNNFCNSSNQNFTPQIKGIFSKAILK